MTPLPTPIPVQGSRSLGTWAALVVLAILPTVGLVVRIRVEERVLLEGLWEPYRCRRPGAPHSAGVVTPTD